LGVRSRFDEIGASPRPADQTELFLNFKGPTLSGGATSASGLAGGVGDSSISGCARECWESWFFTSIAWKSCDRNAQILQL
ncbi:MAG: hypothetical protein ACR2Q4_21805, partial [Geminicoccaceae bacterium]